MSFIEKIANHKLIEVTGGPDLTTCRDLLVVIRQERTILEYVPSVVSASELGVVIPYEDAMRLSNKCSVSVQLVGVDADNIPFASYTYTDNVLELLKEGGYRGEI